MEAKRLRPLNSHATGAGPVVYWMQRDQRVRDNWALHYAMREARDRRVPLHVVFALQPSFLGAQPAHFRFMLEGLRSVSTTLQSLGISFHLLQGTPGHTLPSFVNSLNAGLLISDFSPLREPRRWREAVAQRLNVAHHEVDAHNVIPPWVASNKREYAARTLRPKLQRLLHAWQTPVPPTLPMEVAAPSQGRSIDWGRLLRVIPSAEPDLPIATVCPGEDAARKVLDQSLDSGIWHYDRLRNDPNANGQSGLSPYLHFGQISPARVVHDVLRTIPDQETLHPFLEEVWIRRELAENFCHYETSYDSISAFPQWAQTSLEAHADDPREFLYSQDQWEAARTHDPLWNAAQRQLVVTGKIHGYLRMFWAKKIIEWSASPQEALRTAIYLNDKYSFDGRDPNGYTGIAWSIGGLHDRAFGERPVLGKIRYMSSKASRRKFDVEKYVLSMGALEPFPFDGGSGSSED